MKNYITFTYGEMINLDRCLISSATDTTITNYYNSTDSLYVDFSTIGISAGQNIYIKNSEFTEKILLGRIASITSTVVTLVANPGLYAYEQVLKKGFISPMVELDSGLYTYPIENYCGSSTVKKGESYRSFPLTSSLFSDSTLTNTPSIISMYFKKGNSIDEIRINVKNDKETNAMKIIHNEFTKQKNINFSNIVSSVDSSILSVNSIISSIVKDNY